MTQPLTEEELKALRELLQANETRKAMVVLTRQVATYLTVMIGGWYAVKGFFADAAGWIK